MVSPHYLLTQFPSCTTSPVWRKLEKASGKAVLKGHTRLFNTAHMERDGLHCRVSRVFAMRSVCWKFCCILPCISFLSTVTSHTPSEWWQPDDAFPALCTGLPWVLKYKQLLKAFPHVLYTYGFSVVWVLTWPLKDEGEWKLCCSAYTYKASCHRVSSSESSSLKARCRPTHTVHLDLLSRVHSCMY
jgi:hypothetical protein